MPRSKKRKETDLGVTGSRLVLIGELGHQFYEPRRMLLIKFFLKTVKNEYPTSFEIRVQSEKSEHFKDTYIRTARHHSTDSFVSKALSTRKFRKILIDYLERIMPEIPEVYREYFWGYINDLKDNLIFRSDRAAIIKSIEALDPFARNDARTFSEIARLAGVSISAIYGMQQFRETTDEFFWRQVIQPREPALVVFWRSSEKQPLEYNLPLVVRQLQDRWKGQLEIYVMDMDREAETYRKYEISGSPSFVIFIGESGNKEAHIARGNCFANDLNRSIELLLK